MARHERGQAHVAGLRHLRPVAIREEPAPVAHHALLRRVQRVVRRFEVDPARAGDRHAESRVVLIARGQPLSCAKSPEKASYLGNASPALIAKFSDADPGDVLLTGDFAIWPADHPDQRFEFQQRYVANGAMTGGVVPEHLTDGVTYAWQVRADDGTDTSAWSKTCYFTVDLTRPAAPAVTSSNYPPNVINPGGVPVKFTFTPNGSTDVIGYQFSWNGGGAVIGWTNGPGGVPIPPNPFAYPQSAVKANRDGTATVSLIPPPYGFDTLSVQSIDHAFNTSAIT
jgi:hypothetical protein